MLYLNVFDLISKMSIMITTILFLLLISFLPSHLTCYLVTCLFLSILLLLLLCYVMFKQHVQYKYKILKQCTLSMQSKTYEFWKLFNLFLFFILVFGYPNRRTKMYIIDFAYSAWLFPLFYTMITISNHFLEHTLHPKSLYSIWLQNRYNICAFRNTTVGMWIHLNAPSSSLKTLKYRAYNYNY